MLISDKSFKQEYSKFVRHVFFEHRVLYLEHQMGNMYFNDPSMPNWPTSVRALMDDIIYLDAKSDDPIKIIIDSLGGSSAAFMNLIDVMQVARSPIYTIGRGEVASAAVPILAAGNPGNRYMFPNSITMVHMPFGMFQGDSDSIKAQTKEFERIEKLYIDTLVRLTGRSSNEIEAAMRGETYMTVDQSIAFGLADRKITSLQEIFQL